MLDKNWVTVKERLPDEGVLCEVYFPMGQNNLTGETTGPITLAYYRKAEGWIHADVPTKLAWEPYYWQPYDKQKLLFSISTDRYANPPGWRNYHIT